MGLGLKGVVSLPIQGTLRTVVSSLFQLYSYPYSFAVRSFETSLYDMQINSSEVLLLRSQLHACMLCPLQCRILHVYRIAPTVLSSFGELDNYSLIWRLPQLGDGDGGSVPESLMLTVIDHEAVMLRRGIYADSRL